jgi:hypothetical protein
MEMKRKLLSILFIGFILLANSTGVVVPENDGDIDPPTTHDLPNQH